MENVFFEEQKKKLQLIVLESPYQTLHQREGKILFSNLMELKLKGYLAVHENKVMPFDSTDFIATHLIISDKSDPLNKIYMSYKSTSYFDCLSYNISFPFLNLLQLGAHPDCLLTMQEILKQCRDKKEDLSYDTGWTINPTVRENKNLQSMLKEMVTMFVINHHRDYSIPHWVTLGILKVKTDQFFLKMGLQEISPNPIVKHPFLNNTEGRAVLSQNHFYSSYTHELAYSYQSLWDERLVFSDEGMKVKKAA